MNKKLFTLFVLVSLIATVFAFNVNADNIDGQPPKAYIFYLYFDNGKLVNDRDAEFPYYVTPEDPKNISGVYRVEIIDLLDRKATTTLFDPRSGNPNIEQGKVEVQAPYRADGKEARFYSDKSELLLTIAVSDSSFCDDDGVCEAVFGENYTNCENDCSGVDLAGSPDNGNQQPTDEEGVSSFSVAWMILGAGALVAVIIYLVYWLRSKRNTNPPASGPAIGVFLLILTSSIISHGAYAQSSSECRVVQASWPVNQVIVGQTLELYITINDIISCLGQDITVTVYEDDYWPFEDNNLGSQTVVFNSDNQQIKIPFAFTADVFAKSDSEEGGQLYFYANARGIQTWRVSSGYAYFFSTAKGGTPIGACVANDGKYACSKTGRLDCSDADGCAGKSCVQIPKTLCGTEAPKGGGTSVNIGYTIPNPFGATTDIIGLFRLISQWITGLAVPVMVILIIWSGIKFIMSRGNTGEIQKAKTILNYALVGLAIVLIGRGFIELILTFLAS